ncbi:MAG: flagellin [bacterium]|nr:flagellin [bacterium]
MIVQHNMSAANANRQLGINSTNLSKSTEKLSSGYRINRAGDDAAGLSISEKMRGQIRGLDQASTNAQDGISLIQTAEGALDETHNILQRMRELSVQAANDTNADEDRTAIKEEITQLTKEIDRIAETTQFNTKNLIDGSFKGEFQIGANNNQSLTVEIGSMTSASLGLNSGTSITANVSLTADSGLADGEYSIKGSDILDKDGKTVGAYDKTNNKFTINTKETTGIHANVDGGKFTVAAGKITSYTFGDEATATTSKAIGKLGAGEYTVKGTDLISGDKIIGTMAGTEVTFSDGSGKVDLAGLGLVAGDVADTKSFTIKGIDVSSATAASGSLDTIDAAIKSVSSQRSTLGAIQNRLEHTISNLDNSSENLQSAESRIRDVDMAEEMVKYSKSSILQQASQSMLAQAKNSTQGVLSLLQ